MTPFFRLLITHAAFCAGVSLFAAAAEVETPRVVLEPFRPSGIYQRGERAGWTFALAAGETAPSGGFGYALKTNNQDVIETGVIDFENRTTVETRLDEPAMLYLEYWPADEPNEKRAAGAAIAPRELQPSVPRPADFDAFWAAKLKLLEQVPVNPIVTPRESGRTGVEYATVKLGNIDGATVHGQLAKPVGEGKFPAMLMLQWAGGPYPLQKAWVVDHAARGWLALNIEPHDVPGDMPQEFYDALPRLIKNYNTIYNDDRDRNYFLQMYLGAYRAAEYLTSRPDWNGEVFVVTGTSMGGQQSFAVAGLHPKVTHMIVHVPAGADTNGDLHGRRAGYPNWDSRNPEVMATSRYFDTVNFASRIKATSLVSMGFLDTVTPPVGIWIAFNQIAGPKEAVPLRDAPHNHQATVEQQRAYTDRAEAWLAALVKGETIQVAR